MKHAWVGLRGLVLRGGLGVYPEELDTIREYTVDLAWETDIRLACRLDQAEAVIDYARVAQVLQDCAASRHFGLVESAAAALVDAFLAAFPQVRRCHLVLAKAGVPQAQSHARVCLLVQRTRQGWKTLRPKVIFGSW